MGERLRSPASGTTVICGLERLGLRVARALIDLGERVTVVAESPQPAILREVERAGARFVQGSSAEIARLRAAAIDSARCLVLTENADLGNLEAALAAREVNPGIRIVLRMFNAELADRARGLLSNSRILSASREAAPYFVASALGVATADTRHVWGRHLVVLTPGATASVEAAPGARQRLERLLVPGRDGGAPAGAGSGGAEQPVELGDNQVLTPIEPPALSTRRSSRRTARLRRAVRAFFDLRLAVTLSAVCLLVLVTAAIFHATLRLSWIDAVYVTVTSASSTGLSSNVSLLGSPLWLKVYGIGFTFAAALSMAMLFTLLVDAVIGARILEALGVPRGRMRNHAVVVGLGNTGYRVVQLLLDAGVEVAAGEMAERGRFVGVARRQGVPVLIADGRYRDSLSALSVEGARAVVAVTDDDLANLETALTARELNREARVVARLFDQELAERAQQQFDINACHSVSALAAPAFVAAALDQGVLSTVERGGRPWLVAEVNIDAGAAIDGVPAATLERDGNLQVLAVCASDGVVQWRPTYPAKLHAGSRLLVACGRDRWQRLRAEAAARAV